MPPSGKDKASAAKEGEGSMAQTGVIYGAVTGIVRRVVAGDNVEAHVRQGEALYLYDGTAQFLHELIAEAEAAIEKIIGKKIPSALHATVDLEGGMVEKLVLVDPTIDVAPVGKEFVEAYSKQISTESIYDKGTGLFENPVKTVDVYDKHPAAGGVKIGEEVVGGPIEKPTDEIAVQPK